MNEETPTLSQVIKNAIETRLSKVHVSLPGKVISYNSENQTAKVQPLIKKVYKDGTEVSLPALIDVPVMMMRSNSAFISMPIKKDDAVLIFFTERSLDEWKVSGGEVSTDSRRMFDLSDAFCYPGGYSLGDPASIPDDDLNIVYGNSIFSMTEDGKFSLGTKSTELVATLIELLEMLLAAQVFTGIGNQPFIPPDIVKLNVIKAKLEEIKK